MKINFNYAAMRTQTNLSKSEKQYTAYMGHLSAGKQVISAKENPSGLAMSRRMRAQIKGLQEAQANAQNSMNVIMTAESGLSEIQDILQRMNEIAIRGANGTLQPVDREYLQQEVEALKAEIQRIRDTTQFNGATLIDGGFGQKVYTSSGKDFQVLGYENITAEEITVSGIKAKPQVGYNYEYRVSSVDDISVHAVDAAGGTVPLTVANVGWGDTTTFDNAERGKTTCIPGSLELKLTDPSGKEYTKTIDVIPFADHSRVTEEATEWSHHYDLTGTELGNGLTLDGTLYVKYTVTKTETDPDDDPRNTAYDDGARKLDPNTLDLSGLIVTTDGSTDKKNSIFQEPYQSTVRGDLVEITDKTGKSVTLKIDKELKGTETERVSAEIPYNRNASNASDQAAGADDRTRYGMTSQVGSNEGSFLNVEIPDMSLINLGVRFVDVSTQAYAQDSISDVKAGLQRVSMIRSQVGAMQNRMEHTLANLKASEENTEFSYSTIIDADMAAEMIDYTTYQVLTQVGTSMLAQANQRGADMLQLIQ